MKILVLGSKGQLGRCLHDQLVRSNYEVIYASRVDFDLCDMGALEEIITTINPHIVINASGYTAVDKAESNQEVADVINHLVVAKLACVCKALDSWLIHMSTDYIFDGKSKKPYFENDRANPQGIYGESKRSGELAIQRTGCKHIIIRTSWVFSEYGHNFLKTMLSVGADHDELSVVVDQIGCPTYAQDIAQSIVSMVPKLSLNSSVSGIFHYCGDQACSWYEFAQAIFLEAKVFGWKTPNHINAIATAKYPTLAVRPPYSALSCSKIYDTFEIAPSNWREGIKCVLAKLNNEMFDR